MLYHVLGAIGGCQVGAAIQVIVGHADLVLGQDIAQINHALPGIRGILAVWEFAPQLREVLESL